MPELTKFQYDLLATLHQVGPIHGLGLGDALEARQYDEVSHPRLYTNLDALVDKGLLQKSEADGRTNEYRVNEAGRDVLDARIAELKGETDD